MTNEQLQNLVYSKALNSGFSPIMSKLIVAQSLFETAGYTSNVFKTDNNFGGMMYVNSSAYLDAIPGLKFPSNESSTARYAHYENQSIGAQAFVNYFKRKVQQGYFKNQYPTIEQYCTELKSFGYFTANLQHYINGVKSVYSKVIVGDGKFDLPEIVLGGKEKKKMNWLWIVPIVLIIILSKKLFKRNERSKY